jgi:hypothetical protein
LLKNLTRADNEAFAETMVRVLVGELRFNEPDSDLGRVAADASLKAAGRRKLRNLGYQISVRLNENKHLLASVLNWPVDRFGNLRPAEQEKHDSRVRRAHRWSLKWPGEHGLLMGDYRQENLS